MSATKALFKLRFSKEKIPALLKRYGADTDRRQLGVGDRSMKQGFYTKADFIEICDWKTRGRPRRFYTKIGEEAIQKQTGIALSDLNEEARIRALLSLRGIGLPTASMLLHLAIPDRYPVIDFRTLWSLSCETNYIGLPFWIAYVDFCRKLADECGLRSLRDLDRALWQYSKEEQRKSEACT